ncbi:hypothetical protein [Streptantibioticus silvisoli]|uniref:Uncharacterized protein n=1 Tax=Streptantibioticus silvisoli TaxID=2705255 RepID=A0ABT6W294_9ACTN|nr:hypothetical protein [Streptantibioticus silvisoli]MDI5964874.1 hypothetical protein [Streptantibioticus silvisoli]
MEDSTGPRGAEHRAGPAGESPAWESRIQAFAVRRRGKAVRWAVLAWLVASFVLFTVEQSPIHSDPNGLADDVQAGNTSVVRVHTDSSRLYVHWRDGPLLSKTLSQPLGDDLSAQPAGFEDHIRFLLRDSGRSVRFTGGDSAVDGPGALSAILPADYPFFLSPVWTAAGTVTIGLLLTVAAFCLPGRRSSFRPAWPALTLLTGAGFFTYLWMEPAPLLRLPSRRGSPASVAGGRSCLGVLLTFVLMGAGAYAIPVILGLLYG